MAAGTRYGVEICGVSPGDAADVAALLEQIGHAVSAQDAAVRIEATRQAAGAVLVAADYGPLAGLIAVVWAATLQHEHPVARITTFVVNGADRRRGIGRMLLKAAAQAARAAGCDLLEAVAAEGQPEGLAFCQATGFIAAGSVLVRPLRRRSPA